MPQGVNPNYLPRPAPAPVVSVQHPPIQAPPMRQAPVMLRPQRQTQQTAAVAQQGRAAIDARRQAAQYGLTQQNLALQDLYLGGAPSRPGATPAYQQFRDQQGFGDQGYAQTFGRTDTGAYAGYKTEGELKAALLGRAELSRQNDLSQADAMRSMLNDRLDALSTQYDQSTALPNALQTGSSINAQVGSALGAFKSLMPGANDPLAKAAGRSEIIAQVQQRKTGDYLNNLDQWYAKQADPLVTGLETANQIAQTPTRDYATTAGRDLGVDPALIAGWFPMAGEIKDASDQRNLESLHTYGLPYSDQQNVLGDMQTQAAQQTKADAADQQMQMADDILGATSFDAGSLASKADLPIDEIHNIIQTPEYADASQQIEQALAIPDADAADRVFQGIINDLANDPALQRLLTAQYAG